MFTLRQLLHVLDVSLDVQHPHALRSNQTLRQVGARRYVWVLRVLTQGY